MESGQLVSWMDGEAGGVLLGQQQYACHVPALKSFSEDPLSFAFPPR